MNLGTEFEQIVLSSLKRDPHITKLALANIHHRSSRHVQRALESLKEKGYIQREGSNRNGYWKILK